MGVAPVFHEFAALFPQALVVLNKGKVVFLSPDSARLLGFSHDDSAHGAVSDTLPDAVSREWEGCPFSEFFEDIASFHHFCTRFLNKLEKDRSISTIFPVRRIDGEFFLAKFTGKSVEHDAADAVLVIEDITGPEEEYAEIRSRFEQVSHDLGFFKNFYQQVLETVNIGIVILSPDCTILELNPYIEERLGRGWIGKKCHDMCERLWSSGHGAKCPFCRMDEVLKTGKRAQELVTDRSGAHWIFSWAPVKDGSGRITSIIKTIADITPEMKLKERIALQEEFMATIVETIPAGILILDEAGNVEYVNHAFSNSMGNGKSAMLGAEFSRLECNENNGVRHAMASGRKLEGVEFKIRSKKGGFHAFQCNFYPLNLSDNRRRGLLIERESADAILNLRQAEARLRSLDKQVSQRDRAIQVQEKLAAVGRLAAGITHELNTPTTYVRGHLQVLERYVSLLQEELESFLACGTAIDSRDTASKIDRLLAAMKNSSSAAFLGTERIMNIIRSMRGFVREQGDSDRTINLYEPLRDAMVLTFNRIKQHGTISINGWSFVPEETGRFIAMNSIAVAGCSQRLCQLFVILVNNSIDAWNEVAQTRKDIEFLHLEITVIPRGNRVQVIFCDNAGGMTAEVEEKAFEPFFTTRAAGKGTGLGLNIALQIVREHQGEMTLENSFGKGVCWHISLPGLSQGA